MSANKSEHSISDKAVGPIIGFCIGVWDTCHYGHLRLLERAKDQCCHLVVAVVEDAAVKAQKGTDRPINKFEHRLAIVNGLKAVDEVLPSTGFDPYEAVLETIKIHGRIDKYFRGSDQTHIPIDKIKPLVGEVITIERTPDISTTQIVEKMK